MSEYIEVDGLRVGPHMVRAYLESLTTLEDAVHNQKAELSRLRERLDKYDGLLHSRRTGQEEWRRMMLTDIELEIAARKLCELRGTDPGELVDHGAPPGPDGSITDVLLSSPRWQLAISEIREFCKVQEAIDSVRNGEEL